MKYDRQLTLYINIIVKIINENTLFSLYQNLRKLTLRPNSVHEWIRGYTLITRTKITPLSFQGLAAI